MAMGSFASAPLRLRMTATFMVQGEPTADEDCEEAERSEDDEAISFPTVGPWVLLIPL